jgi:hypothetical protein
MSETEQRVDEVSEKYVPARGVDKLAGILFWVALPLSFLVLFPDAFSANWNLGLQVCFLILSVVMAVLNLVLKFWLLPGAEQLRRKQLLSDAFGVPLTTKSTSGYYNNGFEPSYERLAAHTMENSFFGKEISAKMLVCERIRIGVYALIWFVILAIPHEGIAIVVWITQLVFSADGVSKHLSLEYLRFNHARTYDDLHNQFMHQYHQSDPNKAIPATLSSFAEYECTKARSGVLLDSSVFNKHNSRLSDEWKGICEKLEIPTGGGEDQ